MGTWGPAGVEAWSRSTDVLQPVMPEPAPEPLLAGDQDVQFMGINLPEPLGGPAFTKRIDDDVSTRRYENAAWRLMQKHGRQGVCDNPQHYMTRAKQAIGQQIDFAPCSSTALSAAVPCHAEPLGGPAMTQRMRSLCADIDERRLQNALWRLGLREELNLPNRSMYLTAAAAPGEALGSPVQQARDAIGSQIDFPRLRQLQLKQAMVGIRGCFSLCLPYSCFSQSTTVATPRSEFSGEAKTSAWDQNASEDEGSAPLMRQAVMSPHVIAATALVVGLSLALWRTCNAAKVRA